MRKAGIFWVCWSALVWGWGCGQDPPVVHLEGEAPRVVARLVSAAQAGELVRVQLIVEGEGLDAPIAQTQPVNPGQRTFDFEVQVPLGSTPTFRVEGYDASGQVRYSGTQTLSIQEAASVGILMTPTYFTLLVTPSDTTVHGTGAQLGVAVDVYQVEGLFGVSFELEYDSRFLKAVSAEAGQFLGGGALFFSKLEEGRVTVSVVKKRGAAAASGSGRLALIRFQTLAAGESFLRFNPPALALQQSDGSEVAGRANVVLGLGTVRVGP